MTTEREVEVLEILDLAIGHVQELEDAWRRGIIDERDNLGGTRSNRNVDVRVALRKARRLMQGMES